MEGQIVCSCMVDRVGGVMMVPLHLAVPRLALRLCESLRGPMARYRRLLALSCGAHCIPWIVNMVRATIRRPHPPPRIKIIECRHNIFGMPLLPINRCKRLKNAYIVYGVQMLAIAHQNTSTLRPQLK